MEYLFQQLSRTLTVYMEYYHPERIKFVENSNSLINDRVSKIEKNKSIQRVEWSFRQLTIVYT